MQSSDSWRFSWTDHTVDPGDVVSYRVVPVLASAPAVREDLTTSWSSPKRVGTTPADTFRAFFNRGFVMSQFVSRYLDQHFAGMTREDALKAFKAGLKANVEDTFRAFLSGQVRTALLELLEDVAQRKVDVFAALFELSDPELVPALRKLGARAHVVLANGSIEAKTGESAAQARHRDENERARTDLLAAGC